jgi:hypothetical protein
MQQNVVAKHMNRIVNEWARSMRLHVGLPTALWSNIVSTVVYLIHRGPSGPLKYIIPGEVWSRKEVNISCLKVFGYLSYVHIHSYTHRKVDAKS